MFAQLTLISRQLSQTADESTHLYSGYRYLKCGDLTVSPEHPPLAKIVAAAPLLLMNEQVDCAPFQGSDVAQAFASLQWFYSQNWQSELFWARMAVSVFAVGLCLLVWIAARRMFGFSAAVLATLIVAFEPNVLASGALVMTDMAVTTTMFCAVFAYYLYARKPCTPLLLLASLAVGLTLLSKSSGVVLIPILVVLAAVNVLISPDKRPLRNKVFSALLSVGSMLAIGFVVVWMGYGLRYAPRSGPLLPQGYLSASHSASGRMLLAIEEDHLLPQAYLAGLTFLNELSSGANPVFILGKIYPQPQRFFFAVAFLIRSTFAFLAMIVLSCFGIGLCWNEYKREILFLLIPTAIFAAVCVYSDINSGIRYLLPLFPFLIILVCAGCMELSKHWRWTSYTICCLLILHAASSLYAFPNYLSYANELWGGSTQTYKYLPSIDSGQSYLQVRDYLKQNPTDSCWLLTNWQWNPEVYGVHCKILGYWQTELIPPRLHGTVIVSSTALTTAFFNQAIAEEFQNIAPQYYIGGSAMLVFKGEFDTRAGATVSAEHLALQAIEQGRLSDALQLSEYAIRTSPNNPYAHLRRGDALIALGQLSQGINELDQCRRLLLRDPSRATDVRAVEQMLRSLRGPSGIPSAQP
ncbi:MAG: phospholipid carrier-dependent glycosyltransferase [Terriglobales bacterium]